MKFYSYYLNILFGLKNVISAAIQSKMFKDENVEGGFMWRCVDCSYSSRNKAHVANHVEAKHIQSQGFNCEYCGKFCPNRNSLHVHISRNHRGQSSVM